MRPISYGPIVVAVNKARSSASRGRTTSLGLYAVAVIGCSSSSVMTEVVPCGAGDTGNALCDQVVRGKADFHDGALAGLGGNGRACSDCHMDADAFQLSPADVEGRFQAMTATGIDDPLFRAVDADDFDANGAAANSYDNLRQNALVRVRLPLPGNIKLVDPATCVTDGVAAACDTSKTYAIATATFTDVWRAVPSVVNVKLTGRDAQTMAWPRGPNPQGGYQLDGRVDTLPNQAQGALTNHAETTTAADAATLADIAAYETSLLADPAPELDSLQSTGKKVFDRACGQCHNGPGLARGQPGTPPQFMYGLADDETSCPPPVDTASPPRWNLAPCPPSLARNERTYEITFPDGAKQRRTTSDPGRALLSGYVDWAYVDPASAACAHQPCGVPITDDWQKMEVSPLHGISKTAPYFHNNSAATLEDVVEHYEEFYKHVAATDLPTPLPFVISTDGIHADRPNVPAERDALVAYLKTL